MFPGHHLTSEVHYDEETKECTLTLYYWFEAEIEEKKK